MSNTNHPLNSASLDSTKRFPLTPPSIVTTHATSCSADVQHSAPVADINTLTPAFADLDDEDKAVVRTKSLRLAQLPPFTRADADDIAQELTLAWASSQARFDPERGAMRALRTTVLERTAAKLLQKARAGKRFGASTTSLEDAERGRFADGQIAGDRRRPPLDGSQLSSQQEVELRLDLQKLLNSLPPNLNELCDLLKERTIAEISRELGIPASTVSSQVSLIRKRFESSKFRELL